jgi:hypothetical protein
MSENPYEPPRMPADDSPVRRDTQVSLPRFVMLAVGIVTTPPAVVLVYALTVNSMAMLDPTRGLGRQAIATYGFLALIVPLIPAYLLARAVSRWLQPPDWWDGLVLLLSIATGVVLMTRLFV